MNSDDTNTPNTTKEAIMKATYRALCNQGYAELTMQAIADELDKSKAALHYHYDTKQNLLVSFLEYLLDRFDQTIDEQEYSTADQQLLAVLNALLGEESHQRNEADEFSHKGITTALLQIRAQALYNDEFRRQLTVNVTTIKTLLATIISDGIDQGVFRAVDPDRTAMTLLACTTGARNYEVTLDQAGIESAVSDTLQEIIDEWLCHPEAA